MRFICKRPGIQMKVEIPSYSSTANSLTDRLEQNPERNTLTHEIFRCQKEYKTEISVSGKFLQRKIVQILERSLSQLQHYTRQLQIYRVGILMAVDPATPLQDDRNLVASSRRWMCKTERNICRNWLCWLKTGAKLSENHWNGGEELSTLAP